MTDIAVTMPDGRSWVPRFVQALNRDKCIGCGRCYRVCGRDVLKLVGLTDDGETVAIAVGEDDDDDGEYEKKVMTIAQPQNCVGCEACARICPKKCYTHAPMREGG
ncbi:ferredoxin III, nif-specific [Acidiferrobacter thiooxydans]|uniref:Ferredoxin III n=1 Tax=Acidiferrobacter thiooxydans TaxID=163359 RepID=A0A1C2FY56_9GAMM|nr:ferredoxin III, nif-specific [Acidiferrobacter thiooxydans]RCN56764.1 ferredoxin III, nif-specific [Acidiferrobacter thiooxydans]UEN99443.1 ferredoxin III, nif-specific [Acidiferrobacter thiooxydans]